jgi:hypothetical protein
MFRGNEILRDGSATPTRVGIAETNMGLRLETPKRGSPIAESDRSSMS